MIRTIHLHGHLKKQFGPKHRFAVATAGEALRALNCAFPGRFVAALREGSYKIVRGDRRNGLALDLDLVNSFNLGLADLHIIPMVSGSSSGRGKGATKPIIGAALIGGAIFMSGGTLAAPLTLGSLSVPGISWGTVAALGLGIALQGVATLMSKPTSIEDAKDDSSFNLNGASNTGNQGDAIQLIYGRTMVGSVNVSFDNDIEDIGAYQGVDINWWGNRFPGGAFSA